MSPPSAGPLGFARGFGKTGQGLERRGARRTRGCCSADVNRLFTFSRARCGHPPEVGRERSRPFLAFTWAHLFLPAFRIEVYTLPNNRPLGCKFLHRIEGGLNVHVER